MSANKRVQNINVDSMVVPVLLVYVSEHLGVFDSPYPRYANSTILYNYSDQVALSENRGVIQLV